MKPNSVNNFSRMEVRAKNLFNVADCRMHWQKSGDYLCVKVDRYSKLKKEKTIETKYSVSLTCPILLIVHSEFFQ